MKHAPHTAMTRDELLKAFDRMRVWQRGDQRAVHKPLLVLLALARLARGEPAMVEFPGIEAKLKGLLEEFGPSGCEVSRHYPFWHLKTDGLWQLSAPESILNRPPGATPTLTELRREHVAGGFTDAVRQALAAAKAGKLVTFGVVPTEAETGYGYIQAGDLPPPDAAQNPGGASAAPDLRLKARPVQRFVEKPDKARAEQYVASGTFSWNSGMFVFHAAKCMEAIGWYKPESAAGLARIADAWDTPQRAAVVAQVYPALPKISVDYGLIEPAAADARRSIVEVPMSVNWKDVGSWPTWAETLPADADGNRANARTQHQAAKGVVVASDDPAHVVSVVGLDNVIVVRTATATLVCRADMAEQVKEIAGRVPGDVQ